MPEMSNLGNVVFNVIIKGLEKAVEFTIMSFGDDTKLRRPVNLLENRAVIQKDRLKD